MCERLTRTLIWRTINTMDTETAYETLKREMGATTLYADAAPKFGFVWMHTDPDCPKATNGTTTVVDAKTMGDLVCPCYMHVGQAPAFHMLADDFKPEASERLSRGASAKTERIAAVSDLVDVPVRGIATRSQIESWLANLARKVEANDVEAFPQLAYFAERYIASLTEYENAFLYNMAEAYGKYQRFTPGQAKGILNWWRAQVQRSTDKAETGANVVPEPNGLDLSSIPSGYYADPLHNEGEATSRLKVRINKVDKGNWSGWIFVNDGAHYGQGQKYGAQRPGQTYKGKCADVLARIVADPAAAMRAYGKLTGTCGNCHRPLEDKDSVEYGLGPVCREKLGW